METTDVREFAQQIDRTLAEPAPDAAVLERLLDDATTVMNALDGETARLHRGIDAAIDGGSTSINELTRELRDCYRDLDLLRPRVRLLRTRAAELRGV